MLFFPCFLRMYGSIYNPHESTSSRGAQQRHDNVTGPSTSASTSSRPPTVLDDPVNSITTSSTRLGITLDFITVHSVVTICSRPSASYSTSHTSPTPRQRRCGCANCDYARLHRRQTPTFPFRLLFTRDTVLAIQTPTQR